MNVLEARRRLLGAGVYKKTVTGNPAIAQGSLARMYPGIEMQGWTEQAQYEGKNLFDADKAKQLSSWIGTSFYRHFDIQLKPNTTYTLFVSQNNMYKGYKEEYDDNFALYLGKNENSANTNERFGNSSTDLEPLTFYTFTTTEGLYYINLYVNPWSEENLQITFDELLVNMMLVEGSSIVPYEPYTGGQPSPSPDYPQEIVSAGNWDETAQKWEYEIEISNAEQNPTEIQTVTLQSDRPLTKWDKLTKKDGQWGWEYGSAEIVFDGSDDEKWIDHSSQKGFYIVISDMLTGNLIDGFCNSLIDYSISEYKYPSIRFGASNNVIYVTRVEDYASDINAWKTWLQSNPITVLYQLAEPVFTPLSASEQESLNALRTNRPTTVLSNDAGCEMALTYKTKKSLEVTA